METLSLKIDLQQEFLKSLNQTPEQFGNEIKFWAAISMYYFGKLNLSAAADFLGYNILEFELLLNNLNPFYQKNGKEKKQKFKRYFGCGKHIIKYISDDFNDLLPEFKEYMPMNCR